MKKIDDRLWCTSCRYEKAEDSGDHLNYFCRICKRSERLRQHCYTNRTIEAIVLVFNIVLDIVLEEAPWR